MKADKLLDAIGSISDKYIEEAAPQKRKRNRPIVRSVASLATLAAVFFFVVFGNMLLNPKNTFTISAFAMESDAEGKVELQSIDLVNQPDIWSGYALNNFLFINVGLKCEGKHIKSVEFSVEDGIFAKLSIDEAKFAPSQKSPIFYVTQEDQIPLSYLDFETVGNQLLLDENTMTDDLLIFWGKEIGNLKNLPEKIEIYATATFTNGETQQQTITIDLSGEGVYSLMNIAEEKLFGINNNTPVIDASYIPEIEKAFLSRINQDGSLDDIKVRQLEPYEDTLWQNVWSVTFDVLPKPERKMQWIAGNGEDGTDGWIINKSLFIEVALQNGKIEVEILGTGF